MIEALENAPADVLALSLSGTVIESDLIAAAREWSGLTRHDGPARVVLRMEEGFDGYEGEIIRALSSSRSQSGIHRIAVLTDAGLSSLLESELSGLASDGFRTFARRAEMEAYRWVTAS